MFQGDFVGLLDADIGQQATVTTPGPRLGFQDSAIRLCDIVISVAALCLLGPLLIIVAITVYLTDPGPIFFAHRPIGRDGQYFMCLKFRSMVVNSQKRLESLLASDAAARAEWARDHKLRNDPRITPIGRFLRRSSIDELPQLINVLRGDMSIVGPRPIVAEEAFRYGRYFSDYCRLRPGLTGLWQVSGRNDIGYRRRVALDVAYSRKKSIGLNLKIIAMTVPALLMARGSY